jgi:hypothetical protein
MRPLKIDSFDKDVPVLNRWALEVEEELNSLGHKAAKALTPAETTPGIVEEYKDGVLKAQRDKLNFIDGSNITISIADNPATKRADISIAAIIPPTTPTLFTEKFRWNRADRNQFIQVITTTGSGVQQVPTTVVTTQSSSARLVFPYLLQQHNVSVPLFQPGSAFLYTLSSLSADLNEELTLLIDHGVNGGSGDTTGIIFVQNDITSEGSNYYLLGMDNSGQVKLSKYIGGIEYVQGNGTAGGGFDNNVDQRKRRLVWVIDRFGGSRVYAPGNSPGIIYEVPMTLGNSTVWASGKFGIKTRYDGSNGSAVWFSRMRVLSTPVEAEQMFM